ncbi:MAG TPA: cytochrome c oxidase subunit II [Mycobacteriales bacterium]|nr:cytochrome c oxidase subunit II [Mycobacteriales bacterium]HVX69365.1 cytochrome c oxidase subunit II [Mycobacteriales bacterium]
MLRRSARIARIAAIPAVVLLASGCTGKAAKWERGGWPEPVTKQGRDALHLWQGALVASLIVGGLVLVLIIGAAILFRRRSDDQMPRQVRYNLPIEVLYTFIPVVVVSVLFYFTAIGESAEDKITDTPNTLQVGVVGFQWSWQFNYLEDGLSVTGRPGQPPEMVVPVDRPIHFYLTSPDVIHSFWVVPFLFKRDVIPGHPNQFEVTVTSTGVFAGKCAEYCGVDHDRMLFTVRAVPEADYEAWLATAKTDAANGSNDQYSIYTGPKTGPKVRGGYLS